MKGEALEIVFTSALALLETTFVLVGLLLLHGLRRIIGGAAFYIALGLLLIFTQLVGAAELKVVLGYPGADFYIASSVLFLPYLTSLMIVYVTEGTLVAQRLIIGAMATLGLYVYLSNITALQCSWPGYAISQGPSADLLDYLLRQSQLTMAASILAQALDLFLIPIFFQRLRNLNCRMFFCVLGSLMLTQLVDSFVFVSASYWGQPQWWVQISSSYLAKAVATIWLSLVAALYLSRIEHERPGESRRTLDIILSFFGSYGKAKALEQNLRESEERYRIVVQNASDMIILLNREGLVVDANRAAIKTLSHDRSTSFIGRHFEEIVKTRDGSPVPWECYSRDIPDPEAATAPKRIHRLQCVAELPSRKVELELSVSGIFVGETPILMAFGRDMTEQRRLERDREEWRVQASHRQRLEAIGRLAGGIAHDFNNYIHAVQGHLDILKYMYEIKDMDVVRHLEKIDKIICQAGTLTSQLLGFARKGKNQEKVVDVCELAKRSADLFMPTQSGITFSLKLGSGGFPVKGDPVQLQQALLNLMINAKDAMYGKPEQQRRLTISVDSPEALGVTLSPPQELKERSECYCCIRIEDSGTGIEPQIMTRIFEPFFTTKPIGKGTGMGLAMAYGTMISHNGWIQVESVPGSGTAFTLILPVADQADIDAQADTDSKALRRMEANTDSGPLQKP